MDNLGKQRIDWAMQQFMRFLDESHYSTKDDPYVWCPTQSLRFHYKQWIEDQGLHAPGTTLLVGPISRNKINNTMTDLGYTQTRRRNAHGRQVTGWAGLWGPGSLRSKYGRPPLRAPD